MAKDYQQALQYLNSFLNLEKKAFFSYKESLKLSRVYKLAEYLNIFYKDLKAIHIAGTKGKGSTAHFIAYLLASLGYKVGLFTSPHFFSFRERIKIVKVREGKAEEKLISEKSATEIIEKFKDPLAVYDKERPTYFELITFIGLEYFLNKKVDYAVVEVGLGGRLDSTNIINPLTSVITHIGYDHVDLLGNSLAEIAAEKAGIIKEKIPVVSSYQRHLAAKTIKKIAKKNKSSFFILGKDFQTTNIRMNKNYTSFDFEFGENKIKKIKIYAKGSYQVENAGLALASVAAIKKENKTAALFKKALSQCRLTGRFEVVSKKPLVVVDVAHNQSSARAVSDNLKRYYLKKKIILVFSCSSDKKPNQMLSLINYDVLILTQFNHPRSFDVFQLKKILKRKAVVTENLKDALKIAKDLYTKQSLILICGSFFLAAEAKKEYVRI
ncbi:MAG: bifunctional folylpolyglutamate synthase/dihydrofolate synthase [Candidatus Omnitrophica bacterium]|nr:bifunctional folylpolyglutamate synthase/dihydrofolate synthase [Candidatus Omnitrophota bacterium]MCF7891639.1 bifunctional folylpolyglutamate synthase/dihydrofolate synthase [Candidatus Omnitrophota bacterium]MCF7895911.1 bifunctional folylpolyglutamate synthase/dihydrofolate synthase [Candidatus Omnitrophota bacterium]MCF7897260.1 bifunctional folylpolyglutamate synthase/dihydrofolate synthase [Candidatus Omnitrophota bacterium]MCF7909295.1 bifunctional folylpolyglutamate synthase/dihydro